MIRRNVKFEADRPHITPKIDTPEYHRSTHGDYDVSYACVRLGEVVIGGEVTLRRDAIARGVAKDIFAPIVRDIPLSP